MLSKSDLKGSPVRIIIHWTAGSNTCNSYDREHYHYLIDGNGKLFKGTHSIKDNDSTGDGRYAAHCRGSNTKSIGISLCGMFQSKIGVPGPYPINKNQWEVMKELLVELCRHYKIAPTRKTVLFHSEVQSLLGIKQNGKWDIDYLPWSPKLRKFTIGDNLRSELQAMLKTNSVSKAISSAKSVLTKEGPTVYKPATVVFNLAPNYKAEEAILFDSQLWVNPNTIADMLGWKKINVTKYKVTFWLDQLHKSHGNTLDTAVLSTEKGVFIKMKDVIDILNTSVYEKSWDNPTKTLTINKKD